LHGRAARRIDADRHGGEAHHRSALPLDEASAKIRSGPPGNYPEDAEEWAATWTGVLPITQVVGVPVPAPDLPPGVEIPQSLVAYGQRFTR
jgi:hypothetical protein